MVTETGAPVKAARASAFVLYCRSPQGSGCQHPSLCHPQRAAILSVRPSRGAGGLLSLCHLHPHSVHQGRKRGGGPPFFFFNSKGLPHSPRIQTCLLPRTWLLLPVGIGSGVFSQTAVCPSNTHLPWEREKGSGGHSLSVPLLSGVFSLLCLKVRSWETMVWSHGWAGHK